VAAVTVRLLPYAVADGPSNMAADEALLETAVAGGAALRFYGWSSATLSLGYFQPAAVRLEDERLAALPWLRRPSGGGTLVHHYEATYALALPEGAAWGAGAGWLQRMHEIIAAALKSLGIHVALHVPRPEQQCEGCLCFRQLTRGDLILGSAKVTGSAQRRRRGAVLQHGAVLLAASAHTPALPGIRELANVLLAVPDTCVAIQVAFTRLTGWALIPGDWTEQERNRTAELAREKYAQQWWNAKR
jgi:lipoyl(octanoyl) transferase